MNKVSKKKQSVQNEISFFRFLLKQKYLILIFSAIYIALYFFFNYAYPYPLATLDSGGYAKAALVNQYDGFRPFGYSQFLIILHSISPSISLVSMVQFLINALASLFFIFTIKYFFKSNNRLLEYIYYFLLIFSALILFLTFSIISDSLFTSFSLIWITSGIWIMYNNKTYQSIIFFIIHMIALSIAINIRYTGLFYAVISVIIVLITLYRKNKIVSILISIIPILVAYSFYSKQSRITREKTGIETFSGFSGWQMANNALNVLPYIKPDTSNIEDKELKEFVKFAVKYDSILKPVVRPSALFLWDKKMPLKQFLFFKMQENKLAYMKEYTYLAKNVYGKFGNYVMINYPFAYLRYYLVPNLIEIFYPPAEMFQFNFNKSIIPKEILTKWFNQDKDMFSRLNIITKTALFLRIYSLIIWILSSLIIIYALIKRKKIEFIELQVRAFWLMLIFILIYIAFSIYASPFILRYIAPIYFLQITIIYILLNSLFQKTLLKDNLITDNKKLNKNIKKN